MAKRLAERALIARIRAAAAQHSKAPAISLGIGDDAALLRVARGSEIVVTTDLSIEGVHFRRDWEPASTIGKRCLVRALSDLAAMAATPLACFLSLALPSGLDQRWADHFLGGFLEYARRYDAALAGGDLSTSQQGVIADVVAIGSVPVGSAIRRSGARPGDLVYVTGMLGAASASLRGLRRGGARKKTADIFAPQPQLKVGVRLRGIASAMIDTSDGLSTDLAHLCEESGVSAMVDAELIPKSAAATLDDALHGGEDYQLLFTASPDTRVPKSMAGVALHHIGWISRARRGRAPVSLRKCDETIPLVSGGWEHFTHR